MTPFTINECNQSQIPALQLLMNLGYTYLPQDQLERERSYKTSSILLEGILREQLKKLNRIIYKGSSYLFSEENIQTAIQKLKTYENAGLQKNNEAMYEFITLGTSLKQMIESTIRRFD